MKNWIVLTEKQTVVAVLGPELKGLAYAALEDYEKEGRHVELHDSVFQTQPKLGSDLALCCYCSAKVGKGALVIDGSVAHKHCHKEACK